MSKRTSLLLTATMLSLIALSSSCATLASPSPPELPNRTLRLSLDQPTLEYQYPVCTHRFLGVCTHHEMHKEIYDLRDEKVRKQLIDMGFVVKVREK
jgi:hypothetical protein